MEEKQAIELFLLTRTEESFCVLFKFLYPKVRRYFLLRGLDGMAADELAQNVMLIVYRRAGDVRDKALFSGWLFQVARNEWRRYWQQHQLESKWVAFEPLEAELAARLAIRIEESAHSLPDEWMACLEPEEREIIALRFVEELSYEELAIALGLALHLSLYSIVRLPAIFDWAPQFPLTEGAIKAAASILAYALALALNLEIAAEYRHTAWLRAAWLALAANAGLSIARTIVESALLNSVWSQYTSSHLRGLLQHLVIIPANGFLLLGVLAMWWAYHRVGLGFAIKRRDWAAMAGILALILALLAFRENLSEAQSPYLLGRYLQPAGLVLLSIISAVSLALHRLAMQMGGGKLAVTLRWLMVYVLLRSALVLEGALRQEFLPELSQSYGPGHYFRNICWQAVPWVAALAAAYRTQLTVRAAKALAQQRAVKATLAPA